MSEGPARVALVTGAARGIGRAIACALARDGYDIVVGYQAREAEAQGCVREIEGFGRRAIAVGADLGEPSGASMLTARALAAFPQIDVLINNAGLGVLRDLAGVSLADWDRTMDVNVRAPFQLAQTLIPPMAQRGWGRVVFLSSVVAFTGGIIGAHYAASKAALLGLTHYLAATFAASGVTVNAVAPGFIDTEMLPAGARGELLARIPVGRLGRADEVAEIVASLVRTGYLTGQTVVLDGGRHFH